MSSKNLRKMIVNKKKTKEIIYSKELKKMTKKKRKKLRGIPNFLILRTKRFSKGHKMLGLG